MNVPVANLAREALDWAFSTALNQPPIRWFDHIQFQQKKNPRNPIIRGEDHWGWCDPAGKFHKLPRYHEDWQTTMPVLQDARVASEFAPLFNEWDAHCGEFCASGSSILEAGMRAFIIARLGTHLDLPNDLPGLPGSFITVRADRYEVGFDPDGRHGYFEAVTDGDEDGGGLWFEGGALVDFDGVPVLPEPVILAIKGQGIRVPE